MTLKSILAACGVVALVAAVPVAAQAEGMHRNMKRQMMMSHHMSMHHHPMMMHHHMMYHHHMMHHRMM